MKNILTILILILVSNFAMSQKITYSSSNIYHRVRLSNNYPVIVKRIGVEDQSKGANVQTPFITTKKVIYGTLVEGRK